MNAVEKNRKVFATYTREKLLQFIADVTGGFLWIDGKKPNELSDEELREFALALTQGH